MKAEHISSHAKSLARLLLEVGLGTAISLYPSFAEDDYGATLFGYAFACELIGRVSSFVFCNNTIDRNALEGKLQSADSQC